MSRRRQKAMIKRAAQSGNVYYGPQGIQGNPYGYGGGGRGSTITLPASVFAQMIQNLAPQKNQAQDFAPGSPLQPYQGVVPLGGPRQWSYGVGSNLTTNDRTLGSPDIPSFVQLRNLAQLYEGVSLCERVILDLIPKLTPKVMLRKDLAEAGLKEEQYQAEIKERRRFVENPSPAQQLDIHSWLRMAWTEQTQIDALALFRHMTKGKQLYGLEIISGDTIKPLLDERGMVPQPPFPAYQQYPYGVPGDQYTIEQLTYYRESPRAFTPYGFSRIERIIMRVNQALRKEQKDLLRFTEGNVPSGIMEVPPGLNWTPDQIDSYEQMWNALISGNTSAQVKVKFTQPGMKYTKLDPDDIMTPFDEFLLNVCVASYGLSMGDIGFTEDIHKSSGDSQENMMYRRTLAPLIEVYASLFTRILNEVYHDDRFVVTFEGFAESEDLQMQAAAYTQFATMGAISPAGVARIMKFPDIPETGPLIMTKSGPIPLANFEEGSTFRQAQDAAQMAGLQLAAQGPQSEDNDDESGEEEAPPEQGTPASSQGKNSTPKQAKQSKSEGEESPAVKRLIAQVEDLIARLAPATLQVQRATWQSDCTCSTCQQNNGVIRAIGEPFPSGHVSPPCHDGCTCETRGIPVYEQSAPTTPKTGAGLYAGTERGNSTASAGQARTGAPQLVATRADNATDTGLGKEFYQELKRWKTAALHDLKEGKVFRGFTTILIPEGIHRAISLELANCTTAEDIRTVFERAKERESRPFTLASTASGSLSGGNQLQSKSDWRPKW